MTHRHSRSFLLVVLLPALFLTLPLTLIVSAPKVAFAAEDETQKEANVHFQRAVGLYSEADYKAALVEFKKAYEIAPHVTVLYNLGQTYYQLQNYAEALTTFERFLAEGGTAHRAEVENAVNVLKARVGKVDVTTTTPGWEISVDDEVVGKTPLSKPIAVSIGKRKISATKSGEATQTRFVEIPAGETTAVALSGSSTGGGGQAGGGPADQSGPQVSKGRSPLLIAGWVGTGLLAAGAVVTGILASGAESDLDEARNKFPGDKADIDSKASTTTTLAITTDVLALSAIILGGVSLYFTLAGGSSSSSSSGGKAAKIRLSPSASGGRFAFTF
jgi:hypothetical protein